MSDPRRPPRFERFAARTPTLPPATHTNSYALGGGRDVLIVEPATPYDDEQRAWLEWVRAFGSQGRRVLAVVATHHHPDHVGAAAAVVREIGVPLWAHAETAARIDAPVSRCLSDGDDVVLDAPEPERWRVLHTPGHAPGHVCLHEEASGAVVVGDMVASVGTILIAPGDGDMRAYLAQLERLASLGARVALPAHGAPIDEPTALFRRYIAHRLRREAKVLASLEAHGRRVGRDEAVARNEASEGEGASAEDLVALAYDDVSEAVRPLALLSLRAHLEKLVADGRVRTLDGVRYTFTTCAT